MAKPFKMENINRLFRRLHCAALHSRCTSIRAVIDVADITAVPQWVPSMFEIWRSD